MFNSRVRYRCFKSLLNNLAGHRNFRWGNISNLSTADTPFNRLLNASEMLWSWSQKTLHTGQGFHCRSFHHIDDNTTNQRWYQFLMGDMDTNGTTHRMSNNHNLWRIFRIEGWNHLSHIPGWEKKENRNMFICMAAVTNKAICNVNFSTWVCVKSWTCTRLINIDLTMPRSPRTSQPRPPLVCPHDPSDQLPDIDNAVSMWFRSEMVQKCQTGGTHIKLCNWNNTLITLHLAN